MEQDIIQVAYRYLVIFGIVPCAVMICVKLIIYFTTVSQSLVFMIGWYLCLHFGDVSHIFCKDSSFVQMIYANRRNATWYHLGHHRQAAFTSVVLLASAILRALWPTISCKMTPPSPLYSFCSTNTTANNTEVTAVLTTNR